MIWKDEWKVYKSVFSGFAIRNLEKLSEQGYFNELKSPISIGKEANIFSATTGSNPIIIKIFRLENSEFNRMREYLSADPRYMKQKSSKRQIIFAWAQREYRNLLIAREHVRCPTPIAFKSNIILMELLGDDDTPAPMLKDYYPADPKPFFDQAIAMVKKLWKAGWVHGDLSGFNILNLHENPAFIDFSQMTASKSPIAMRLLERDVNNICHFFRKDVKASPDQILEELKALRRE